MSEQRLHAYKTLIEQLLSCPQREVVNILQSHLDLVDDRLLVDIEQIAAYLEEQENGNAQLLREFATQLGQELELQTVSAPKSEDAAQFLLKTFQLVMESRNPQQIYLVWAQQQIHFNQELLAVFPTVVGQLLAGDLAQRMAMAAVLVAFGNLIQQFPMGTRWLNLELGIAAYQQALTVMTQTTMPTEWATTINHLANAYSDRIQGDRAENIEQAINYYQQALKVRTQTTMPVDWAEIMSNLAIAYRNRIQGDRAENIEQAINYYQQTLRVRKQSTMPIGWASTMINLANAYSDRIQGDRAENIEQAINYYQQALSEFAQSTMPVDWATTMNNLATAYKNRIKGDRAENIEQAINYYQQALSEFAQSTMPVDWAGTTMNLANAYSNRIKGDRAENLEQAINYYQQTLSVFAQSTMPVDWATTMNNLALAYSNRIKGDRAENLEQAINYYQQALKVRTQTAMPVDWAETINNLATAYKKRIRSDRAENLEQAIDSYQQALKVRTQTAMPVAWAGTMLNLAAAYYSRIRGNHTENIEKSINYYQQALNVFTQSAMPVDWATTMNNLAAAYKNRIKGDRPENIEQAIDYYQQALKVTTRSSMPLDWADTTNNLATAYRDRIRGDRAENIEQAVAAFQSSLTVFEPEVLPNDCRRTARSLGDLFANAHRWPEAVAAYQQSLQATELLYQASLFRSSQEVELSETDNLFRHAAFALAKIHDLTAAAVTLERGRARGLSETLERDRADLTQLAEYSPERHQQYQAAAEALREMEATERSVRSVSHATQLSRSLEERRQRATHIRQDFKTAIESIRQLPGYETFLNPPDFSDITAALHPAQPLIYLTTTANGSLSLTLSTDSEGISIQPIWQEAFTENDLQTLLFGLSFSRSDDVAAPDSWFGAYSNQQTEAEAWLRTMEQVTEHLWSPLMAPIVTYLSQLGVNQAVLIPTGLLGLLPLHSAWTVDATCPTGRRYALDNIQFSYIPNAQSLQAARVIADRIPAHSLLAVDEPRPTTANELPNSEHEVQTAIAALPNHTLLRQEQATRSAIRNLLPQHTALHFSGHGFAQLDSPLDSGLVMANDEILTLRDLLNLRLPGLRLAILSACETGLPGTQLPDEVISLPTGLLQAGVAGVVASLWSVADISTMLLLIRFYDFWQGQRHSPAAALCQAQQWVRDTTNGEKLAYFRRLMQEPSLSKIPKPTVDYLYKALVLARASDRDFAHPFYWAAFSHVGV